jgi:clan AA aspartic protease (TIGR02281 family)
MTVLTAAVELLPARPELELALVRSLAAAGRMSDAAALARRVAEQHPEQRRTATALLATLRTGNDPDEIVIRFAPHATVIETRITVAGRDVTCILDTGATSTTLPRELLSQLGLLEPGSPRVRVDTASGTVEAESVRLARVGFGTMTLENVRALAIDLPGAAAGKGLLGMDLLRRFDLRIDRDHGLCVLRRKAGRR